MKTFLCVVLALFSLLVRVSAATPKVLLIGIDGLRPDAMLAANAPNLQNLMANGCWTDNASASAYTWSGPGWSDVLCGVWPDKHNVIDNSFTNPRYTQYPHFFKRLKEARPSIITAHYSSWGPIDSTILGSTSVNYRRFIDYSQNGDALLSAEAANLLRTTNLDIMYFYFADVDIMGHTYGFSPFSPEYIHEIEQTDAQLGTMLAAIRARANYANENWLIIVTSDHGGTLDLSHGRNEEAHRRIPFIISGPTTARGKLNMTVNQVDVPAIACAHLGITINPAWGWDGRVIGLDLLKTPYNVNLLYNGDAEAQSGSTNPANNLGIAGWEDWGDMTVLNYGSPNGFPELSSPGPPNRGASFFCPNTAQTSTMSQTIEVVRILDQKNARYELSGWLGGYGTQNDLAYLQAHFFDKFGHKIAQTQIGPVTNVDRMAAIGGPNPMGLLYRSVSDKLPMGTRWVKIILTAERQAGSVCDGYADNLSFIIRPF